MKSLMLLDTASMYYRAFHSLPEEMVSKDGTPVNAIRGLIERISKLKHQYQPDLIVAAWDTEWRPQWRVDLIPSYKTHRTEMVDDSDSSDEEAESLMPDSLAVQLPIIDELLQLLGIPVVGHTEYEADDIIGTYANVYQSARTHVVTGDRDLFQLIDDDKQVSVLYTAKGDIQNYSNQSVLEKYGIQSNQYVDYSILRGDPSDGLPGVKGIGEKTAAFLINQFTNLDLVIDASKRQDNFIKSRIANSIITSEPYLRLAQKVVPVVRDVPVPDITELNFTPAPPKVLNKVADDLNLKTTILKAMNSFDIK